MLRPASFAQPFRDNPAVLAGEEGKKLCIDVIQQIREIKGVHSVHVMAYCREYLVGEIIEESGILKERLGGK